MIDAGLSVKRYDPNMLNQIEHILITHKHSDHLHLPLINWFYKNRPTVLNNLHVNNTVLEAIENYKPEIVKLITGPILTGHTHFKIESGNQNYKISTFPLYHDTENQGFIIENQAGEKLIHATDTSSMRSAPDQKYDYILVEGNWDENLLWDDLDSGDREKIFRASRNLRHLSVQKYEQFVHEHSHIDTVAIQLHESFNYGINLDLN